MPRSNQCAEHSIKVMQELYSACKNKDKLKLKFILSNLIRNKKLRLDTKWFIGEAFNTFVSTFFSSK